MDYLIAAFTIGIIGSLHCIGMCGPIALSLPLGNKTKQQRTGGILLYNAGRIFTYSLLGLLFGSFGKLFFMAGLQQVLSIAVGGLILIYLIIPARFFTRDTPSSLGLFVFKIKNKLSELFRKKGNHILFLIGLLNGLLPCGLVYVALAGATATGSEVKGALFMFSFGLATAPVMFMVAFLKNYITANARGIIRKSFPYLTAGMAILLVLRGLNLGIPYISPEMHKEKKEFMSCCTKSEVETCHTAK
jgi:uncharacterized protein